MEMATLNHRFRLPKSRPGRSGRFGGSMVWRSRNLRDLQRSVCPLPGKHFDKLGHMPFLTCLGDEHVAGFGSDEASIMDDSQDPLPRPHWAPASYPQLFIPQPLSLLSSDSKWIQSMVAGASSKPFSRETSVHMWISCDRQGRDLLGCKCSTSPIHSSLCSSVSLPL